MNKPSIAMRLALSFGGGLVGNLIMPSPPVHAILPPNSQDFAGLSRVLTTPAQVIDALHTTREQDVYMLHTPSNNSYAATIDHFYLKDDRLSLSGSVPGIAHSSFILKGNRQAIYGWLVFKDHNLAYEYTTNPHGDLVVTQVELTKIIPDCHLHRVPWSATASLNNRAGLQPRQSKGPEAHIGEYEGQDLHKLQSLPGAAKVIYLDITDEMNGDTPINFDKAELWKSWQAVASGFSMFEVNVTTDAEVYAATDIVNTGLAKYLNEDGRAFAELDAFGTAEYAHVFTTPSSEAEQGYGVGRTALHELGHIMGLSHDGGGSGGEYFEGIDAVQWCPIMGNYYIGGASWGSDALYQWSRGEYDTASNDEDDFAIIGRHLEFRADDIADNVALKISDGEVSAEFNRGRMGADADSDGFTFTITASKGHAKLHVDRTEYLGGAMLDVDASIVDSAGKEVARDNPQAVRYADLDVDLPKGSYTLVIQGGSELTPADGFSTYSSMGYYAIEGTIDGANDSTDETTSDTSALDTESTNGSDETISSSSHEDDDDDDDDDDSSEETSTRETGDDATSSGETSTTATDNSGEDQSDDDDDHGTTSADENDEDPPAQNGCGCISTGTGSSPAWFGLAAACAAVFRARRNRRESRCVEQI